MWQRHRLSLLLLFPIQEESCNAPNQFLLTTRLVPTPPESSAGQSLLFPIHEQSLTADGQWAKFASSLLRRLVVDWTTATNRWYSTSTQKVIKSGISLLRVAAYFSLSFACIVCPLYSVHCTVHKMLISFAQLCTVWLRIYDCTESHKGIASYFNEVHNIYVPNYKIFPEVNSKL